MTSTLPSTRARTLSPSTRRSSRADPRRKSLRTPCGNTSRASTPLTSGASPIFFPCAEYVKETVTDSFESVLLAQGPRQLYDRRSCSEIAGGQDSAKDAQGYQGYLDHGLRGEDSRKALSAVLFLDCAHSLSCQVWSFQHLVPDTLPVSPLLTCLCVVDTLLGLSSPVSCCLLF